MTTVADLVDLFESEAARDRPAEETPDVGVIMGSDSDLDVMAGAHDALTDLGFTEVTDYDDAPSGYSFESWVVSAHRTPDLMYAYAETAVDRGLDVVIAGAGGKSADLPNMTASLAYPLPVVGVPVQEKSVDSVIGMPTGAPLTAVDAGKSYNAGLSAAQFLATDDPELADRLRDLHADRRDGVAEVSSDLHTRGTERFRADRD
ncbi:5-(carboxyamino)imidazole ribonucleotide mutase [Halobacterium jilantaiense]|uniref:N5-carboxyaminoimidazole ribonucleotide mutase n=1 Tax=Halobacterium jilantaiense TaxID=355548 RepID=A0A1I0NFR6_9EURY|nr:5-(carboxyamino)imidazole ribonucleotide mutase [Halobacterium jilantaiense]SEW00299.1 5-(carboxyamino)imidazole ribonucleotide mutase [Halobacterium jilantaiense]